MELDVGHALETAATRLRAVGDRPRADAEELLGRLLGIGRAAIYIDRERRLTPDEVARFETWIERRLRGEPVQYITGRAAFRGLDLRVSAAVLVPRPETEQLVEAVIEALEHECSRWASPRVLDLGTGSGAIALALAQEWAPARVTATDLSEAALEVARVNAATLALEAHVRFLRGDWFDAVPGERFEVVVANPPYIAADERATLPREVKDHEPAVALFSGATGLEALERIVAEAPGHLVEGGLLALELAEARAATVRAWVSESPEWRDVALRDDLAGRPRILCARRRGAPPRRAA